MTNNKPDKQNPIKFVWLSEIETRGGNMKNIFGAALALALSLLCGFVLSQTSAPDGAEVYIISPNDGETVSSPVVVKFGLKGMGVAPAGIDKPNTGHHHLIIDAKLPDFNRPVPMDDNHKHFGGGQTETTIELTPGKHTLQLIMGDKAHIPHKPAVFSRQITITVK
jgi:hypothetical protein